MRRKNTETINEVIKQYLRSVGAEEKLKEIRIVSQWEEALGQNIASQTQKLYFRGRILFVKIPSPIIKSELSMMKNAIINKLNDISGDQLVDEIKFI